MQQSAIPTTPDTITTAGRTPPLVFVRVTFPDSPWLLPAENIVGTLLLLELLKAGLAAEHNLGPLATCSGPLNRSLYFLEVRDVARGTEQVQQTLAATILLGAGAVQIGWYDPREEIIRLVYPQPGVGLEFPQSELIANHFAFEKARAEIKARLAHLGNDNAPT